ILSAGQGRRLLPWTHDLPKCLLPFAGKSLLGWQLEALAANGVEEAVVVTGFGAAAVEREIGRLAPSGLKTTALVNPFFGVADNIASVWLVRQQLVGDVVLLNGDTLFEPRVLAKAVAEAERPVTVTVDTKESYDADDMKVQLLGDRVLRIGKTLTPEATGAESIGMLVMKGLGGPLFAAAIETVIGQPGGVSRWYLSAVDELAAKGMVGAVSIAGLGWTEVDYPGDLGRAEMLARGWVHQSRAAARQAEAAAEAPLLPYPLAQ
ncbi:MAG TPA: phosphocholine cytidylyltransferase family protein, partial [Candidatus Omnitrophota bacterium]|nr:phosphocholine cytidylyltransferase family protein [Candidatus Omnitrophota bacterium]